jgi:hypothetical protein
MTTNAQLTLIDGPRTRRMDERTRAVGRAGIARAREALRAGRHARTQDPPRPASPGTAGAPGQARRSGGGPRRAAA